MSIILVRHGETAGNAGAVVQRPEVPLNDHGVAQAAKLADRLAGLGYMHILSSDLLRARMTAEALRARTGIDIEQSALLQERNFGDLRGTPYAELTSDPFAPEYAPPNGETWSVFHERVARAFASIVERRRALPGSLVVVTHGLVCRALVERHIAALQAGLSVPERFHNTSVTIVEAVAPHTVSLLNCVAHLTSSRVAARRGGPV